MYRYACKKTIILITCVCVCMYVCRIVVFIFPTHCCYKYNYTESFYWHQAPNHYLDHKKSHSTLEKQKQFCRQDTSWAEHRCMCFCWYRKQIFHFQRWTATYVTMTFSSVHLPRTDWIITFYCVNHRHVYSIYIHMYVHIKVVLNGWKQNIEMLQMMNLEI